MAKTQQPIAKRPANKPVTLNIPQSFVSAIATVELEGGFGINSPYVQFMWKTAKNFLKVSKQIKNCDESTIALISPGDKPAIKLDPYVFSPVALYQYWAVLDPQGLPIKTFFKLEDATEDAVEHIDSVVVVYLDDKATLARSMFKSTKCKAMRVANQAIAEASDEVLWGSKGEEYKNTLHIQQPFARFKVEVDLTRYVGKKSGLPSMIANGTIYPTTSTEWKKLVELFNEDDFERNMQSVMGDYEARRKYLSGKA